MADNFQLNLGSLRSSVNLTLHTHHASRLWFGRQRTEGKPGMIGLSGFANILNRIKRGCEQDDPYSDWFLILIEEKIEASEQEMKDIDARLDEVMASLPPMLSIGQNLSVQPVTLPLFLSTPLAFKAVFLLTAYDELVRRILLASHVGLIDNNAKGQWLDEGAAILRRLFGLSQRWKFSGASRDDFAAKNARSEQAREMYASFGEIPQDILEGTRKSSFAPSPSSASNAAVSEDGDDDGFEETITLGQPHPNKSEPESAE
ncbi:PFL_4669 family integrating conjugative element protein [Pseudomonas syringae]|uniref:PFL_4669 family integrating conjugative element protein n=1 Tax=Pseudomonas syringae TaxID=317 RepID=UPI001FB22C98|nr:TIGR03761 family integrating conjugative element protein [Pseudomonas syringae]UOF21382.1 TIGR03761 family integrating conjugative element protein [Pseudomonas syringae CC440]UZA78958.1 TIGR03761 family integrating conjugative element protein [Pseudomonas syringae]